ncbi:hypothetical protein [Salipiger mucosus]|uniref:Lipoprotein n=1 Tax=Salipiger mucosus DSM 16094 TaxID=1123237 RepID=S9RQY8_9RHOB|nr:hypothetical protein [Salipiger mucosus]EPX80465.1 hypothetical protein Salmuc_03781 [Salipiger mucosus DSM 16094]
MSHAMGHLGSGLRLAALAGIAVLGLTACSVFGSRENQIEYQGIPFNGDHRALRDDRMSFVATAKPADVSLDGAIRAAEFEGVKYCISYIGTSDIDWQIGPDTPRAQMPVSDGTLTFRGTCVE